MLRSFVLTFFFFVISANVIPNTKNGFDLHVVHYNDFHARFEEVSEIGAVCKDKCIGGFSRTYVAIQQELKRRPNSIVLNAGDNYQGTLWYNLYKWNVTQHFLNMIPTDAYTLGNHEFDDSIEGAVPFIKALNAPTIATNIDDSKEPAIQNTYKKSIVIERDGKRIGIIGVLFAKTDTITNSGKLTFLDESKSVNQEAERLVAEENVDTIIVLSHSGYSVDQRIAKYASPKIGLVVGAHSHTFLYTGDDYPGVSAPAGPYPTIIKHNDGRKILVVQAAAFTKFLGNITVSYDGNGDVVSWNGKPIYLDSSIPQDEAVNADIAEWKKEVDKYGDILVGETKVHLDQISCRISECNLGSFIADSMIYAYLKTPEEGAWAYAAVALINAGGVRSSIAVGNITYNDIVSVHPFENTLDVGEIQGRYIRESLEYASDRFFNRDDDEYSSNTFYNNRAVPKRLNLLQTSGLKVVYNITKPVGSKLQSVKVRCRICKDPIYYEDLDDDRYYRVVFNSFLVRGGDGFDAIRDNIINHIEGPRDIDILEEYIKLKSPITQEVDGRITILK